LAPDQKLRIAINNYRAAGSAGYSMFRGAKTVWRSGEEIRDLIVRYYTERRALPDRATENWSILPELARRTLEKEAREGASRQQLQ
jgi:2',3'-cyclic-nucleotide 2'-phosphodiesterase/3'-nucleotidase